MEDQYGMPDLRHYIASRPLFPPPPDLLSAHRNPYDMLIFRSDSTAPAPCNAGAACFEGGGGAGDGGTGRWPRQETLTLLEIRSRLDPKFKEANQKGPLWDEVSRIMSEEHGYQRSGKKCREKFENLYKYYKKTKEGKAGRQDGKHYRFFRQLEALYGDSNNAQSSSTHLVGGNFPSSFNTTTTFLPRNQESSLSLSNYSDADTSSSDEDCEFNEEINGLKPKRRWKIKIKELIDVQMKKLMDKQEAWMEKMMKTIENKERERMMREEEWRKQDAARIEREHRFWASERAWIEARDAALMETLHKLTGKNMVENQNQNDDASETMEGEIWPESEINRLVQVRAAMEGKFQTIRGVGEEALWEEVAAKMESERSGIMCRDKWESVNNYLIKCNNKKRKEDSKSCNYFESVSNQGGSSVYCDTSTDHHSNNNNANANANAMSESCFRYFVGDGYGRIME